MSDYVLIGKIVNTFGIKGELKITSDSDFIEERFSKGSKIYLKINHQYQEFKISSFRLIKNNPVITINELYDINEVTKYIGLDVYASSTDNPTLDDGEYYIDDLIGKKVQYPDGEEVGIINDIILLPSNDVIEIKKNDGKMELIPFVDDFVKSVSDVVVINRYEVDDD